MYLLTRRCGGTAGGVRRRSALSDDQMQRLAREMNLPETAFLLPAEARSPQGTGHRSRRFTIFSHLAVWRRR